MFNFLNLFTNDDVPMTDEMYSHLLATDSKFADQINNIKSVLNQTSNN